MTQQKKIHLIDTNIIIRYLIGDDKEKADKATILMGEVEKGFQNIAIPSVVIAETVWTLEKFYKVPRVEISSKLLSLLSFRGIKGSEKKVIKHALNLYASTKIDFVDCFLVAKSTDGSMPIYTFDKTDFKKLKADWKMP